MLNVIWRGEDGDLVFRAKGTGTELLRISPTTGVTMGSSGAVLPQDVTIGGIAYTFPADNGDAGEQLQTNGSGVLTWEASGV
jgi:hypothetical protein